LPALHGLSVSNHGVAGLTQSAAHGGVTGIASDGATFGSLGYGAYSAYGSASAWFSGTAYPSDQRLKENVEPLGGALASILALRPVGFNWKANTYQNGAPDVGVIAQEAETVLPGIVREITIPTDADGKLEQQLGTYKGVDYAKLVPYLVAAVQELTARVNTLQAALDARA
jgi:hypothetical protein